ncbi:MAG: NYN domain-containing protein [Actinomycetota bacterium]|jgi:predicted RNA-binding protein with PIN domain|nr:NYN domain-containing protein [Rubrobacter sp.]MDQ3506490.1 NYN domain-containing protein [Actinomycetota bacterium]
MRLEGSGDSDVASYMVLDGYNVIGGVERYRTARTGGLDESRELLINDALKAAGWTGSDIIIIFDAHRSPEPMTEEMRAGGAVRLVFSGARQSADDVIERLLPRLSGAVTLYTADFALQRAAIANGAVRATPREFQTLLDELPAVTRNPNKPVRSKVADRLSRKTLEELEEVRRKAEGG